MFKKTKPKHQPSSPSEQLESYLNSAEISSSNNNNGNKKFGRIYKKLKIKRLYLLIFVVLFGAIGAYLIIKSQAATPPQYTFVRDDFGIATGAAWSTDTANMEKSLNDFKTLGVRYIRFNIPWSNFQAKNPATLLPGQSKYNWNNIDFLVAEMKKPEYAGRFKLIVTINNPPEWAYASPNVPALPCPRQPPFNVQAFADATRDLVVRLHGAAGVFEIMNSPNIGGRNNVWDVPNPCGYTQVLKKVYPAIKSVQIFSYVLTGGIGVDHNATDIYGSRMMGDQFLTELYTNGAKGYFDAVAYHPYNTPNFPCDPNAPICTYNPSTDPKDIYGMKSGFNHMLHARQIMQYVGDGAKKIYITENGVPSYQVGYEKQAQILTAIFQRASQLDWVATTCWYTYMDNSPGGLEWGLTDSAGNFKPGLLKAYTDLTSQVPVTSK